MEVKGLRVCYTLQKQNAYVNQQYTRITIMKRKIKGEKSQIPPQGNYITIEGRDAQENVMFYPLRKTLDPSNLFEKCCVIH